MADSVQLNWQGLAELRQRLQALPDKLRRQVLRNALAAGARLVRDTAKTATPVLREPDPRRTAGTVRDAIKVRTSKQAKAAGNVGVFVNVKRLSNKDISAYRATSGRSGANNPKDPYYWRWLNWGRQGRAARPRAGRAGAVGRIGRFLRTRRAGGAVGPMPGAHFLERGAARLSDALAKIGQALGPALQRLLDRQPSP